MTTINKQEHLLKVDSEETRPIDRQSHSTAESLVIPVQEISKEPEAIEVETEPARDETSAAKLSPRCKLAPINTVFEFLAEDHNMLAMQADLLTDHYCEWTRDKVFDETVSLLDGIRRHLRRQTELLHNWSENSSDPELFRELLKKSSADHEQIVESHSALLMQHVDEPDFLHGLKLLLHRIREHIDFSENELFTVIEKHVSREDLDAINHRLNQSLLRGKPI
jgi:hemerythrin-like domain-containing protein